MKPIFQWNMQMNRKYKKKAWKKNVMVFGMTESERIKQNCIFDTEYM